jgi:hypothetical protein
MAGAKKLIRRDEGAQRGAGHLLAPFRLFALLSGHKQDHAVGD